jgi:hypothetical protein
MRQPELMKLRRCIPICDVASRTRELDDMQARVRTIGRVDVTAIVDIEVVRLNRRLALLYAVVLDSTPSFWTQRSVVRSVVGGMK